MNGVVPQFSTACVPDETEVLRKLGRPELTAELAIVLSQGVSTTPAREVGVPLLLFI
jgi:hypothetical protein